MIARLALALALSALLFTAGCAGHARVVTTDPVVFEGRIVRNVGGVIEFHEKDGSVHYLREDEIAAIEHPGDEQMVLGGVLGALGLLAWGGLATATDSPQVSLIFGGLPFLIPAAILFGNGLSAKNGSKARARRIDPPGPRAREAAPTTAPRRRRDQ